ncbi:magnesium transporter MgtE N-terminal domain-containing protein [Actinoplanes sp. CA-252034]|uniref:magnesium transporter MgtE N-terminal domain-containing protein n=1 Tax=Actinoplanes sp. CA-252034 TaxID=3239906 RepID=UPI003D95A74E
MIRQTPPQSAISMLNGLPADRFTAVADALSPADLARLMLAGKPGSRGRVLQMFVDKDVVRAGSAVRAGDAAAMLAELPADRLRRIFRELPEAVRSALLATLPEERRDDLLGELDEGHAQHVRTRMYVAAVTDALRRFNAEVGVPENAPDGILYVSAYHKVVAIAAHLGDDGRTGVPAAENAAYWLRSHAALSITDLPVAPEVRRYCADAREKGRPLTAVTWADPRDDGPLKRALASLFS